MIADIIAVVGLATTIAGAGASSAAAKKQAAAEKAKAYSQYLISQEQARVSRYQQAGNIDLMNAQLANQETQRKQSQLQIATQRSVIEQQQNAEDVRRGINTLQRNENAFKSAQTDRLEGLNQINDVLNTENENQTRNIYATEREKDQVDRRMEQIQGTAASLALSRQHRDVIRQGVLARSSGLVQAVAQGRSNDSSAINARSQVSNDADRKAADAGQDYRLNSVMRGLATDKRELGVIQRGFQENQFELGTQSRQLGVAARGINYETAKFGFATSDAISGQNDKIFDINKQISSIYLNAQDRNSELVNESYANQANLTSTNTRISNAILASQERVFQLGGDISLASKEAASAGTLAAIGSGLSSFGSSATKSTETFDRLYKNYFGGGSGDNTAASSTSYTKSSGGTSGGSSSSGSNWWNSGTTYYGIGN